MALEINTQFQRALDLMEKSNRPLFITGKAGTGKSTLLDYFRRTTKKNIAVLAPTGVAAVNVRGQTIHSFFGFTPSITPDTVVKKRNGAGDNLYKQLDALVIDEISMVRADLLDCVDKALRLYRGDKYSPFGGVQMIFIGDLFQLPPVVTTADREYLSQHYDGPYFFDAQVLNGLSLEVIELEKIYRQQDEVFIKLLNRIRTNTISPLELGLINGRCHSTDSAHHALSVYLTTTNATAEAINQEQLARLPGDSIVSVGQSTGEFLPQNAPTQLELTLKVGAQVMLLNNDSQKRWVNGSIGKIKAFEDQGEGVSSIAVLLNDGTAIDVLPYTWEQYKYAFDDDSRKIMASPVGTFTQYPLKLAWAMTIHKSQGKTFDRVVIDLGRGAFAHGQMYVALSRCTTLKGITLRQPLQKRHLSLDNRVVQYLESLRLLEQADQTV